ncbi:uncharacterized protein LOC117134633 isoform X1 [Drosophila busckii]|uniref:uncharacterized protein LOC117134633 isoform X1 n=1 Tax=Drosophila busckii TaxID=30019 RepID=UPI00083ECF27|nr:uncharacterized protein LOC117134633 isoform X1 [Drosophila busckii]
MFSESEQAPTRTVPIENQMTDVNWTAYDAFRRDLAKVHKTFSCCTQTDFTEEAGTLTDLTLGCKFVGKRPPKIPFKKIRRKS